jgi:hypothetical protein
MLQSRSRHLLPSNLCPNPGPVDPAPSVSEVLASNEQTDSAGKGGFHTLHCSSAAEASEGAIVAIAQQLGSWVSTWGPM